ncbi:hypothetical protein [Hydrogenophaga sp. 2FB]|uniref:hypothetical protein n=1 Tax=Hydrogenophaga sp. 2FB TaxID=2502187 RepID=UPI0010F6A2B9|nr:hypothetical protein [Hydrogenophaga sp. 2FB]
MSTSLSPELIRFADEHSIHLDEPGRAHAQALGELFESHGLPVSINVARKALALVHHFIEIKAPLHMPNLHWRSAAYKTVELNPATVFCTWYWCQGLDDELTDLMRRYMDAGYFSLADTQLPLRWDQPSNEVLEGVNLFDASLRVVNAKAAVALLRLGADPRETPSKPIRREHLGTTIEVGVGEVSYLMQRLSAGDSGLIPRCVAAIVQAEMLQHIEGASDAFGKPTVSGAATSQALRRGRRAI